MHSSQARYCSIVYHICSSSKVSQEKESFKCSYSLINTEDYTNSSQARRLMDIYHWILHTRRKRNKQLQLMLASSSGESHIKANGWLGFLQLKTFLKKLEVKVSLPVNKYCDDQVVVHKIFASPISWESKASERAHKTQKTKISVSTQKQSDQHFLNIQRKKNLKILSIQPLPKSS